MIAPVGCAAPPLLFDDVGETCEAELEPVLELMLELLLELMLELILEFIVEFIVAFIVEFILVATPVVLTGVAAETMLLMKPWRSSSKTEAITPVVPAALIQAGVGTDCVPEYM